MEQHWSYQPEQCMTSQKEAALLPWIICRSQDNAIHGAAPIWHCTWWHISLLVSRQCLHSSPGLGLHCYLPLYWSVTVPPDWPDTPAYPFPPFSLAMPSPATQMHSLPSSQLPYSALHQAMLCHNALHCPVEKNQEISPQVPYPSHSLSTLTKLKQCSHDKNIVWKKQAECQNLGRSYKLLEE